MEQKGSSEYKYIDMHCHILPGLDDGSRDMEMSLQMARLAVENNIDTIIATPHYSGAHHSPSPSRIRSRAEEFQRICEQNGIDLRIYPGNELLYDSFLPDKLSSGEVLTLADSRYCLVEFYPLDDYRYIQEGLRKISYAGFRPILAHCERYACLLKEPGYAADLAEQQVLLQCNSASVPQKLFQAVPKFVNGLLRDGLVSFIATDAHRAEGARAPALLRSAVWMQKKYSREYIQALLHGNARRVIAGDIL